ncbi:hypothetical protein [Flavobacterium sp. 123]|uniref:hypothetical protein n=1 Tax=Flavobacterium sp. 123 TaxID=2135627 RepID=UPI000EADD507|nr:hypothetical protein [Flavobacterium sp. 123]RKS99813.1 hypothetical protein C8C88_1614 [Flavobacterium sp. 123]
MKNLIVLLFLSTLSITFGQNQKLLVSKLNHIPVKTDQFLGYDQFGFYYSIKDNTLSKTKEDESFQYKNPSLGKITKVNFQNPLKIVLFYEDFNTAILLDNQLNESQKINFSESITPLLVSAIGIASQNKLWVLNSLNQQIELYDYLKKTSKSISTPIPNKIKHYQSDSNKLYWIDDKNDSYSCDMYGKITRIGKIPNFEMIQILNENQFIFTTNNILYFGDYKLPNQEMLIKIEILEKTLQNFSYKDQILSIFTSEGITNYKITKP